MSNLKLKQLADVGQSIWLDYINRAMLDSGRLSQMIEDGLRGMTSNPSIFNQAIGSSQDYDDKIRSLSILGKTPFEIYDELTIKDIQDAADAFRKTYDNTNRLDGYVSLEINPLLADQAKESIEEGMRLFNKVNRPNLMIKVPATEAGFEVIEALTAQGINVNCTLIFSMQQYVETFSAYLRGLMRLHKNEGDLSAVRSVASVFVSRIDTAVDHRIDEMLCDKLDKDKEELVSLKGKAAVANSRLIFLKSKELVESDEFKELEKSGANIQRVLWASTGTKNPNYSDIKYVSELIGKPTVNTIPEKTLEAFIDHGIVEQRITCGCGGKKSREIISSLKTYNIIVDEICRELMDAGVVAFEKAFESLLNSIAEKAEQLSAV